MRILYGVQGTGNGHISRARAMARELAKRNIEVQFVFTGRARDDYFDMEAFGNFLCYRGLTFITKNGSIQYFATAANAGLGEFNRDVKNLDVAGYDLILVDFEPVTAWAAKRAKLPCIGIGHQYAFDHDIPIVGDNLVARSIMRHFAPVSQGLGLHWHHFNNPILPPIIADEELLSSQGDSGEVLVYLPFEDQSKVVDLLQQFEGYRFNVFTNNHEAGDFGNASVHQQSFEGFQVALRNSTGVICNAGFELSSEALFLGKKLLVKPLAGQMEQLSNAEALKQLGLGRAMQQLDAKEISDWLSISEAPKVDYPNVPAAITDWILAGNFSDTKSLAQKLWSETSCDLLPDLFTPPNL